MERISVDLSTSSSRRDVSRDHWEELAKFLVEAYLGRTGVMRWVTKLISAACAWEEKTEHEERATVSLVYGLDGRLVACYLEIVTVRDRREKEAKGRGGNATFEPDSHGNRDEVVRSRGEQNLKVGEAALIPEEWCCGAS